MLHPNLAILKIGSNLIESLLRCEYLDLSVLYQDKFSLCGFWTVGQTKQTILLTKMNLLIKQATD